MASSGWNLASVPESALDTGLATVCELCPPGEPCICVAGRSMLTRHARSLAAQGFSAAGEGNLERAELLFAEAVAIDPDLSRAWAARGLCAFARGDVSDARRAWRRALTIDPSSVAKRCLGALSDGDLGAVIQHYNRGLALAEAGDPNGAISQLERAGALCPEFLPVIRVEGLLRFQSTIRSDRTAGWTERARHWSSDGVIRHLLDVDSKQSRPDDGVTLLRHSPSKSTRWSVAAAATIVVALGWWTFPYGSNASVPSDTSGAKIMATVTATATPPVRTPTLSGPTGRAAGRRLYLAGRTAFGRGEDSLAIRALRDAAASRNAYYADDALYLLMLTEERVGNRPSAGQTARRLLDEHPRSMYVNSHTRRLASAVAPAPSR